MMWMHVTFLKKKMRYRVAEPESIPCSTICLKDAGVEEFLQFRINMLAQNDVTLPEDAQAQFEKMVDAFRIRRCTTVYPQRRLRE